MQGVRVNKVDLAHIFGIDPSAVDTWLCKGLPYLRKPRPKNGEPADEREWLFDTAEVIEWRLSIDGVEYGW